ncbi:MAG: peptidylprolyl isomerase [Candidatus Aminicenantes bacterium]
MNEKVKKGDTVKIHYTGKQKDGKVFDSSQSREPLEFEMGKGMIIPGLEEAIEGMEVGEKKDVSLEADEAYGQRDEKLVVEVPREKLPEGLEPQKGMPLRVKNAEGRDMQVVVADVDENTIKIDANHPLAGHDLDFEVEVVDKS